jgi:hypothetical protein
MTLREISAPVASRHFSRPRSAPTFYRARCREPFSARQTAVDERKGQASGRAANSADQGECEAGSPGGEKLLKAPKISCFRRTSASPAK